MKRRTIYILLSVLTFAGFLSSCTTAHYPQRGHSYPHSQKWEPHDDSRTVK
ncbi:MAG: hypothetical protein JSS76_19745 [Bacteroidetes bacterium]|nr:hypothetical protein [Bacteroidota bacterium]MBS1686981.1 hypothetical protein [Bacteroidota bacterium]